MTQLSIILILTLTGFYVSQCIMTLGLIRKLRNWNPPRLDDANCPRVAVVLCLRGKDPFLDDCIESLLRQDYPDYQVHVVIDHESDPALSVVEACVDRLETNNIKVEILKDRRETCSLKCSSLLHALSRLGDSVEVVALVDADTSPHRTWLRELVAPLLDEDVGAATGNRWYMPTNPSIGATARYFWNTFAIVQMVAFRIAWGGTLAIRMDVIRNADLLKSWGNAFCEDTMLYSMLRKQGLRLVFVPSLIMINREDCNPGNYFHWVGRQLLTARLYHPLWKAVVLHGVFATALPLAVPAVCVAAVMTHNWQITAWLVAASLLYGISLLFLLWPLEVSVRRSVKARGEPTDWMSWKFYFSCIWALPLLQVLYPMALASAMSMRRVKWRGVEYRIEAPWRIRLVQYHPYQTTSDKVTQSL